ncbi:MAG: mechanosensitive ion channel family protein [Desulfobacterales bacterium]
MTTAHRRCHGLLGLSLMAVVACTTMISLPVLELARADASQQAVKAAKQSKAAGASERDVELPASIDADRVDDFMAALSDEQVRRLLIESLKKQAAAEAAKAAPAEKDIGGLAGFINASKNLLEKLKERIAFIKSGATAAPANVPSIFTYLGTGEKASHPARTIINVMTVFAAAFGLALGYLFLTAGSRRRIAGAPRTNWISRIGVSAGLALMSIAGMVLFAAATLTFFYIFLDRTTPQRVLVATYLVVFLIIWAVTVVSKFLLAPQRENLRFLPISDEAAVYLHRWIVAIATVGSFGILTCGIIRLAGASEATHFTALALVGVIITAMLIWMIAGRRRQVAARLLSGLPENSLRAGLARRWHVFAGLGLVLLLVLTLANNLLTDTPRFLGVKTLLLIPLYVLLDWGLRQILDVGFGLAQRPGDLTSAMNSIGMGRKAERVEFDDTLSTSAKENFAEESQGKPAGPLTGGGPGIEQDRTTTIATEGPQTTSGPTADKKDELTRHVNVRRMQRVIRTGLRAALAAWMAFWLLSIWGIDLPIGKEVTAAVFNILVVVIIGYVAWEVISAAIHRRIKQEKPDDDEDRDEGGGGGSRIGTLLLILRKFILTVIIIMVTLITLSSIGVDIAPLIAGAGVIGLAIGFGAQTLVKDIISGMFFLIDDAIRVGDYVDTGKQKGTVEQISLRSLRLRHPRGMVYTIPFSDIGSVTNFSRDYIITKLDFRVPFDTDVDKVRKLVKKKVYNQIMKDPELGPKLLAPIKSQGVRELDDSALIVRVKYKTQPGEQFVIRKHVYRLMQEAFHEAGLKFAHRNVTVSLPPELERSLAYADADTRAKVLESAAAAAGAVIQVEEEEKAKKAKG